MDGQLDGGSSVYAAAVASAHGCHAFPSMGGATYAGAPHDGSVAVVAAAAASAAPGGAAALVPAEREVREAQRRLKRAETLLAKFPRYRANDYAVEESDLRRSLILNTTPRQFSAEAAFSWALTVVIGLLNGVAGFLFNQGIYMLNKWKFETTLKFISSGGGFGVPYCVYMAFTVLYSATASILGSYVSPQAAGSGIPEIRCYLNGIHVRGLLTIRTFFAKAFGVLFSIAAGLVVGKEGPFTHVGAIIGGGVAGLGSTTLTRATGGHWRAVLRTRFGRYFRSAVSHRDHVAAGAAAGVSSAFGAPIGGILFSVEQGSSFYSANMLSHAFLAAGIAIFVSLLLSAALWHGPDLYRTAFTAPQQFALLNEVPTKGRFWYYAWELPIFALMGVGGGIAGAAMVAVNNRITTLRKRYIPPTRPARRVAEVVVLAALTATAWLLPSYLSPCMPVPPRPYLTQLGLVSSPSPAANASFAGNATAGGSSSGGGSSGSSSGGGLVDEEYVQEQAAAGGPAGGAEALARTPTVLYGGLYPQLWCPDGTYSTYGMLFFLPQMTAISLLFQFEFPDGTNFLFDPGALAALSGLGWLFMTATFGVGAATGLFVPSLLVGGAGGRLVGRAVRAAAARIAPLAAAVSIGGGAVTAPAVSICLSAYAVVGAGAVLGGVSRMLLCNTVLVLETAGATALTVPLIVTTFVAKMVADALQPGIFDVAITRAGYPYLEAEPADPVDIKLQQALAAGDVMSSQLATLPAVVRIGDLVEALRRWPNYSTFPLTDVSAPATALAGVQQQAAGPAAGAAPAPRPSATFSPSPSRKPTPTMGTAPDEDAAAARYVSAAAMRSGTPPPLQPQQPLQQHFVMPAATSLPRVPLSMVASLGAAASFSTSRGASPPPTARTHRPHLAGHPAAQAAGTGAGSAASARLERSALLEGQHGESGGLPGSGPSGMGGARGGLAGAGPVAEGAEGGGDNAATLAQPQPQLQQQPNVLLGHMTLLSAFAHPPPSGFSAPPAMGPQAATEPNARPPLPRRPYTATPAADGTAASGQPSAEVPSAQRGEVTAGRRYAEPPAGPDAPAAAAPGTRQPLSPGPPPPPANGLPAAAPLRAAAAADARAPPLATPLPQAAAAAATAAAGAAAAAQLPPPPPPPPGSLPQAAPAAAAAAVTPSSIIGVISRSVLLKLLEMRADLAAAASAATPALATTSVASSTGSGPAAGGQPPPRGWQAWQRLLQPWRGYAPAAVAPAAAGAGGRGGKGGAAGTGGKKQQRQQEPTEWLGGRRSAMSRQRAVRLLDAVDNYPAKAPADRPGEEKLLSRLSPADLEGCIDLRHYMQRVPYVVPATASLARTYRLFRGLGLHHIFVTAPNIPVIGLITRSDLAPANAYRVAYRLAEREQQQLQSLLAAQQGQPGQQHAPHGLEGEQCFEEDGYGDDGDDDELLEGDEECDSSSSKSSSEGVGGGRQDRGSGGTGERVAGGRSSRTPTDDGAGRATAAPPASVADGGGHSPRRTSKRLRAGEGGGNAAEAAASRENVPLIGSASGAAARFSAGSSAAHTALSASAAAAPLASSSLPQLAAGSAARPFSPPSGAEVTGSGAAAAAAAATAAAAAAGLEGASVASIASTSTGLRRRHAGSMARSRAPSGLRAGAAALGADAGGGSAAALLPSGQYQTSQPQYPSGALHAASTGLFRGDGLYGAGGGELTGSTPAGMHSSAATAGSGLDAPQANLGGGGGGAWRWGGPAVLPYSSVVYGGGVAAVAGAGGGGAAGGGGTTGRGGGASSGTVPRRATGLLATLAAVVNPHHSQPQPQSQVQPPVQSPSRPTSPPPPQAPVVAVSVAGPESAAPSVPVAAAILAPSTQPSGAAAISRVVELSGLRSAGLGTASRGATATITGDVELQPLAAVQQQPAAALLPPSSSSLASGPAAMAVAGAPLADRALWPEGTYLPSTQLASEVADPPPQPQLLHPTPSRPLPAPPHRLSATGATAGAMPAFAYGQGLEGGVDQHTHQHRQQQPQQQQPRRHRRTVSLGTPLTSLAEAAALSPAATDAASAAGEQPSAASHLPHHSGFMQALHHVAAALALPSGAHGRSRMPPDVETAAGLAVAGGAGGGGGGGNWGGTLEQEYAQDLIDAEAGAGLLHPWERDGAAPAPAAANTRDVLPTTPVAARCAAAAAAAVVAPRQVALAAPLAEELMFATFAPPLRPVSPPPAAVAAMTVPFAPLERPLSPALPAASTAVPHTDEAAPVPPATSAAAAASMPEDHWGNEER